MSTQQSNPAYVYYKPKLWAFINNVYTDLISVQADFTLNGIPQCQLVLPVGVNTKTGKTGFAHLVGTKVQEGMTVVVWCDMSEYAASDPGRTVVGRKKPFKVFEGFVSGSQFSRTSNSVGFVVSCNHWLVKLTQGSVFSNTSHPGNPGRFSYGTLATESNSGAQGHWTVLSQAATHMTAENINTDLWGKGLYEWMKELAARDGFWVRETNLKADGTNKQAQYALDRFDKNPDMALQPKPSLVVGGDVAKEIASDIALLTFNPQFATHQTLWDVLVGRFAPSYLFAVVPKISSAAIVPYIPCYQGKKLNADDKGSPRPHAFIKSDAYGAYTSSTLTPRPTRALGVLSSLASRAGATQPGNELDFEQQGLGGWYDTKKDGMVMIEACPSWMSKFMNPALSAALAVGAGPNKAPIRAVGNPGGGARNGVVAAAKDRAKNLSKPLLDAYAKARYCQEVLKSRYAVLSGALRFDVAPGSTVWVGSNSRYGDVAPGGDALERDVQVGEVLRVSYMISANPPGAGTSFHVGNVRTRAENEAGVVTVAEHPLYENTYLGSSLLGPV